MATEFTITNRTINYPPNLTDVVVQGDTNSKVITFSMPRFFDAQDLSIKTIKVAYKNAKLVDGVYQTGYDDAFVDTLDISTFTFTWVISGNVTVVAGEVTIWIEFSDVNYVWKTKSKTFNVEPSFNVLGTASPISYTLAESFYTNNTNDTVSVISDTNEPIYIQGRQILVPLLEDLIVSGDNRSQIISFVMDRFYENVDRSSKTISIKFLNAKGRGDRSSIVNLVTTDDTITFGWLIDSKVSIKDGYINFAIELLGYDENNKFTSWSTKPAQLKVESGLSVDELIEEPTPTWLQELEIQNNSVFAVVAAENQRIENENTRLLSQDYIKGTTQIVTLNTDETVGKIQHENSSQVVLREDVYTYNGDIVTEVRTLNTGESLTFTYNLSTYQTVIS